MCTLALFLSGYAIQQRTLRDLREAIRPRQSKPSPRAYLPERFKTTTRVLEDGTTVVVESEAEREAREMQGTVVEVRPTMPERTVDEGEVSAEKRAIVEALKAQVAEKTWMVENPDPMSKSRVPITRAQRRKMIKDEFERLAQPQEETYHRRKMW